MARKTIWRRSLTLSQACAGAEGRPGGPFQLLATTLEADPYLGRVLTGRIASGVIKQNATIQALSREGENWKKPESPSCYASAV